MRSNPMAFLWKTGYFKVIANMEAYFYFSQICCLSHLSHSKERVDEYTAIVRSRSRTRNKHSHGGFQPLPSPPLPSPPGPYVSLFLHSLEPLSNLRGGNQKKTGTEIPQSSNPPLSRHAFHPARDSGESRKKKPFFESHYLNQFHKRPTQPRGYRVLSLDFSM